LRQCLTLASTMTPCIEYLTDRIFNNNLQHYMLLQYYCVTLKSDKTSFIGTRFSIICWDVGAHFCSGPPCILLWSNLEFQKGHRSIAKGTWYHGLHFCFDVFALASIRPKHCEDPTFPRSSPSLPSLDLINCCCWQKSPTVGSRGKDYGDVTSFYLHHVSEKNIISYYWL